MQISLFLLISIFAFSSGGKLINPHLDRVLQGSANYGSGPNYSSVAKKTYSSYGSGVESRYSAIGSNVKRGSLYLNKKLLQKNERDISLTEPPTHLERVRNPMTDIIPDPLRRITITHTTPSE